MNINPKYQRLVRYVTESCKSLGWKVAFEQDVDGLLFIEIDNCRYFISTTTQSTERFPLYYIGVMIQHHGTRHEPPSEEDKELSGGYMVPEASLDALLEAHWKQRKFQAMEPTLLTNPMNV